MKRKRIEPGPGQESVWDYPRPPALERCKDIIRIEFNGANIARSSHALRILETSHPPTYYIPPADIKMDHLLLTGARSHCEWKGTAHYYDVVVGDRTAAGAAWSYPQPVKRFAELIDHVAFYAHMMDACYVGDDRVQPQEGDFYGGWITPRIVGPFKGASGTWGW